MRHAVIMAGGSGTRLWPLSRKSRPKQLLKLFDGKSLLTLARERLADLFAPEHIWVITSAAYIDQVAEELPDVPRENLIGEPMGRDTSNAVGLAAHLLAQRDPDATMAVFTADHIIRPREAFQSAIEIGLDAAEQFPESLITFGIVPNTPHTGYGYIHRGDSVAACTYEVAEFREKPTQADAEHFVSSGEYFWNSGMFAWRVATILGELNRCLPENHKVLAEIAADWRKPAGPDEFARRFGTLQKISIDYGVMEKARSVLTVEMNCEWVDLGSWSAIASTQTPDADGNAMLASESLAVDARNNILVSEGDHLIVALGVEDLVIVHAGDATIVCRRDQEQRIKDLVELRKGRFGERFE